MRSYIIFLLVGLLKVESNRVEDNSLFNSNYDVLNKTRENHLHLFCHPCKGLFKEVKKVLVDYTRVTEENLKNTIDSACKRLRIHLLKKVCKKIGDKVINKLKHFIVNEDKRIDPKHCCKAIKLC